MKKRNYCGKTHKFIRISKMSIKSLIMWFRKTNFIIFIIMLLHIPNQTIHYLKS